MANWSSSSTARTWNVPLQRVPEDKRDKNRLHLDLRTADLAGEVTRIAGLGATLLTDQVVVEDGWRS